MYYSIDRFEGTLAVLQDDNGSSMDVPRASLPTGARQGDVLMQQDGTWLPAPDETARRRQHVLNLQKRLLNRKSNKET